MTDDPARDYELLRAETARMLNLDPDDLSATESLRLDLTALLRLQLDALQGAALAGREIDLGKLQSCYAILSKLLPNAVAAPVVQESSAARQRLAELLDGIAETISDDKDEKIAELTARLAEKDAVILALGGVVAKPAVAGQAPAPPASSPPQPQQSPQPPPRAEPPAHYLRQPGFQIESEHDRWRNRN